MSAASLALARLQKEEMTQRDYYTGAIVDLIAAGLLLPSQVPGTNDKPKVQATFGPDGQLMRGSSYGYAFRVTRRGRSRAQVCVPVEEAEAQRRRKVAGEQGERERLAELAKHRLERMPRTHADYKAASEGFARTLLESILANAGEKPNHGFSYGDDEWEELLGHCRGILRVLAHGTTLFDASIQSAALIAEKSTIVQADGGFLRMLQSIVPAEGSRHA